MESHRVRPRRREGQRRGHDHGRLRGVVARGGCDRATTEGVKRTWQSQPPGRAGAPQPKHSRRAGTAANGTSGLACGPRRTDTTSSSSGRTRSVAPGMQRTRQRRAPATSSRASGRARTAWSGALIPAISRRSSATATCTSGHTHTAARGKRMRAQPRRFTVWQACMGCA
jgi:hypothetical protein